MNVNYFNHKVILVTGATGLIGSHIVEALLMNEQTHVIALGRSKAKLEATFANCPSKGVLDCVEHDISSPLPASLGRVDYIFHAASPISGEVIRTCPLDVIHSNLNGTINCLEYLRQQGSGKMVVFSSATVYSVETPSHIAKEEDTMYADCIDAPNAPYSESKRMIEVIARAYHKQHGVDILIARFSYVYGYSKNAANTAFYEFIRKALKGEDITMNKSGLPRRDNIYVDDAVEGLLHLCEHGLSGEVYNISSNGDGGNYAAVDEMAMCIAQSANKLHEGFSVNVTFKTQGGERPEGLRLNNEKAKSTGWHIVTTIEEGIFATLKKYVTA
jgi:nucleoside-diphosphate-sugar epimerase